MGVSRGSGSDGRGGARRRNQEKLRRQESQGEVEVIEEVWRGGEDRRGMARWRILERQQITLKHLVVDSHISFTCPWTLQGDSSQAGGHFGSAISILPDLTGDGAPDLAVGAPCEDNNQGAVYIFYGHQGSFKAPYVQRIPGRHVSRKIMYFGRSVAGNVDMTGDNLPDLLVGGEGQAIILR
ncbi:hypothetical protein GDO81_023607 [Engystomops pustulosus]|uniref:Uncharacterized protein n=1 Tax=Engystomops pustulosus TaxID=76066 RepID=A0AAV6YK94_ENGPU|nr:hypothetical protein GDO81_023607 [Engystomops pustulosus]